MTLADKADKLIELWVRELAQESANPYKAQSLLDGHFALEVGGKRNPLKSYINAKETLAGGLPVELKRTVISRMNVRKSCEILS